MSKITIDRSVVEQALEDMEMTISYVQSPTRREDMRDSIDALRAALEQEKSPQNASSALQASCEVPQVTDQTEHFLVLADEEVYCTKQPQVEQEPVAVAKIIGMDEFGPMLLWHRAWTDFPVGTKLYTHPQPPRQPLSDEEVKAICYTGPVYAPDGKVTRTPEQYKREIADARMHGIRQAERAHGIGGGK